MRKEISSGPKGKSLLDFDFQYEYKLGIQTGPIDPFGLRNIRLQCQKAFKRRCFLILARDP